MFWSIRSEVIEGVGDFCGAGRFVLQRHCDGGGEHLDLRLEREGHLEGWRIEGVSLAEECWGTAKAPHPKRWLDEDGDAVCVDRGEYAWESVRGDGGTLLLKGEGDWKRVAVCREVGIDAGVARGIREALQGHGLDGHRAVGLIEDGVVARRNAMERLCGLGSMLDGDAFDDGLWRKTLSGLSLEEIHGQLRGFELRFDRMYPPEPTSKPSELSDGVMEARSEQAMAILHG